MAKKLLLDALVTFLGEFIELDESKLDLSLAVWSGQLVLHNLKLKTQKLLRKFNISILFGSVRSLEIIIPWTALLNSPVKVVIDGIFLQVNPLDPSNLDKIGARKAAKERKDYQLSKADKLIDYEGILKESYSEDSAERKNVASATTATYMQFWTSKILDNIEVTLKNLHARYEDNMSIPGTIFSAGITLDSFNIFSCDENWKESFVSRKPNGVKQIIHKIINSKNLGIYWNTNAVTSFPKEFDSWFVSMETLIYTSSAVSHQPKRSTSNDNRSQLKSNVSSQTFDTDSFKLFDETSKSLDKELKGMEYILAPPNNLVIKVKHFDGKRSSTEPNFDFDLMCSQINFSIDKVQYFQLVKTTELFMALQQMKQPHEVRPKTRPLETEDGGKLWWKYAYFLVRNSRRYIDLVKLSKAVDPDSGWPDLRSMNEKSEMALLEEKIPVRSLIIFRHMAAKEIRHEIQTNKQEYSSSVDTAKPDFEAGTFNLLSFWFPPSTNEILNRNRSDCKLNLSVINNKNDDDVPIESIMDALNQSMSKDQMPTQPNALLYTAKVAASASLAITIRGQPIVVASMSNNITASMTVGMHIQIASEFKNFSVIDRCTPTPNFTRIISVQSSESSLLSSTEVSDQENTVIFKIFLEIRQDKASVKVTALPIEFVLNKPCIRNLLSFITLPKVSSTNKVGIKSSLISSRRLSLVQARLISAAKPLLSANSISISKSPSQTEKSSTTLSGSDFTLEVIFEAHAPKIIIPEDSSDDRSYFLLDTGYLSLKCLVDNKGLSLDINLRDVNAGLPMSVKNFYELERESRSLYLIKPFEISVQMQNSDKSYAEMTVDLSLTPGLRGEIDSEKLSRILSILGEVSATFASSNADVAPALKMRKTINARNNFGDQNNPEISLEMLPALIQSLDNNTSETIITATPESSNESESVSLIINVTIPAIVLDLTYNVEESHHLILSMEALQARVLNRLYDMQICFEMNQISIQDSLRAVSQRFLVRTTLAEHQNLIKVTYLIIRDPLSSLFRHHQTEVDVEIADINMNTDARTVLHLKPFFEVLLSRKPDDSAPKLTVSAYGANFYEQDRKQQQQQSLKGMLITCNFNYFCLDLLRSPTLEIKQQLLCSAYSWRIDSLRCRIEIIELLNATVNLHSFEVIDIRDMSKEFIFRKIFCPVFDVVNNSTAGYTNNGGNRNNLSKAMSSSTSYFGSYMADLLSAEVTSPMIVRPEGEISASQPAPLWTTTSSSSSSSSPRTENGSESLQYDILEVTYCQESKNLTLATINVNNMTSFVEVNTILDFVDVATSNAFALLSLLQVTQPQLQPPKEAGGPSVYVEGSTTSGSTSTAAKSLQPPVTSSTLNCRINIVNPRLLIIDDPSVKESAAIMCRGAIEVHYTRDVSQEYKKSLFVDESLHLTLRKLEVLLVPCVSTWSPKTIVEPFLLEYHSRRKIVDSVISFTKISADGDSTNARIAVRDLIIIESILNHKRTNESVEDVNMTSTKRSSDVQKGSSSNKLEAQTQISPDVLRSRNSNPLRDNDQPPPNFSISIHLGPTTLVAHHEIGGRSVPLTQFKFEEFTFYAENSVDTVRGEGSSILTVDFYNRRLSCWEPILETWNPSFCISTNKIDGTCFDLKSAQQLQLTISGVMLSKLIETYSTLVTDMEPSSDSINASEVTITNSLGVPIDIFTTTNPPRKILALSGTSTGILPKLRKESFMPNDMDTMYLPGLLNIQFCGNFGETVEPIQCLSTQAVKPRMVHLTPIPRKIIELPGSDSEEAIQIDTIKHVRENSIQSVGSLHLTSEDETWRDNEDDTWRNTTDGSYPFQTILEEIYENSRYEPLTGEWVVPYILGDPYNWTDVSCLKSQEKTLESINLPSDDWQWLDNWHICKDGDYTEIDSEGWEYAQTFATFEFGSIRRCLQSAACCRRRRWIRTRVKVQSPICEDIQHPWNVVWDVCVLESGFRQIEIRSAFQVVNNFSVCILIALYSEGWEGKKTFGPIEQGQTFSIPLFESYATAMKIKPASGMYRWSKRLDCARRNYDFKVTKEIYCETNGIEKEILRARVLFDENNNQLKVSVEPYVRIINCVPSRIDVMCGSEDEAELHTVPAGDTQKLSSIGNCRQIQVAVKIGNLKWSSPYQLSEKESAITPILFKLFNDSNKLSLVLSMIVFSDPISGMTIKFYSQQALVDRTDLNVSILSTANGLDIMRPTNGRILFDGKSLTTTLPNLLSVQSSFREKMPPNFSDKSSNTESALNSNISVIANVSYESTQQYILRACNIGELVYSDMDLRWSYLPARLRNQMYLCTPNADRSIRTRRLISFDVIFDTLLLILIDSKTVQPMKWLKEDGYKRISQQAVARRINKGVLDVHNYIIFSRVVRPSQGKITLQGNWSRDSTMMYVMFAIPLKDASIKYASNTFTEDLDLIFAQTTYEESYSKLDAESSWVVGDNGLSLIFSDEDALSIGVNSGSAWSDIITIDSTKNCTGVVDIIDWNLSICYHLYYNARFLPGIFDHTQLLTMMNRYVIINYMNEDLYIIQRGGRPQEFTNVGPYDAVPFHGSIHASHPTSLMFRVQSTIWSLGSVEISEVGSTVLHLPLRTSNENGNNIVGVVVQVEVKQAEPDESCSLVIVVWKATVEGTMPLSVRNETEIDISIRQAEVIIDNPKQLGLFDICVAPGQWIPFGWTDPDCGHNVMITTGNTIVENPTTPTARRRIATLSLLKAGESIRLPDSSGRLGPSGEIILSVLVSKRGGRVLRIYRQSVRTPDFFLYSDAVNDVIPTEVITDEESSRGPIISTKVSRVTPPFHVNLNLSTLAISLIVDKPVRREFMNLTAFGISAKFSSIGSISSLEFIVSDLQIDNYSETAIHPVLLHPYRKHDWRRRPSPREDTPVIASSSTLGEISTIKLQGTADGELNTPLIQLSIIRDSLPNSSTPIFNYFGFRVMPIAIETDSSSLQLLYYDFLHDLTFRTGDQVLAATSAVEWVDKFNRKLRAPSCRLHPVDIFKAQEKVQATKMYFRQLVIHPMKIVITFVQSPFPRISDPQANYNNSMFLNIVTTLAGFDRLKLKLKSFQVEDAMESRKSLLSHIRHSILEDFQNQTAQILGSLAVFGSPVGFANKVGHGVKAFFYEPYQGLVHSPHEFMVGLGKGTSSLFSEVVSGAMNSTVAMVGTASKSLSYLSGDPEFILKREAKQLRNRANKGGIVEGIVEGSENVISGFRSGVTGLITKPYKEAQKGGIEGFIRGIGMGIAGAAVKPILGISDGLTSLASGIQNQVDTQNETVITRPARALEMSSSDDKSLRVVPLNLDAARARLFVIRRAESQHYQDIFLEYIPLNDPASPANCIILSSLYIFWKRSNNLWGRTWANVSHFIMRQNTVCIVLYTGSTGQLQVIDIPCSNVGTSSRLYKALYRHVERSGYPCLTLPLEIALEMNKISSDSSAIPYVGLLSSKLSFIGQLDGYRFGTVNSKRLPEITGPENDVLLRAEELLSKMPINSWQQLDERVRLVLWEWECTHQLLSASRCCITVLLNLSHRSIQLASWQLYLGRNNAMFGSEVSGYDPSHRVLKSGGHAVLMVWAHSPSPLDIGHIKGKLVSSAFTMTIASTQIETQCVCSGGFQVGLLEKTVTEWWCKYVLVIHS